MNEPRIDIPEDALADFCRRWGVRRLAVFGSALRDDFGPDSDVDFLFELEPGRAIGWRIVTMEDELSRILGGRRVDLVSAKYLNRRMRDEVLSTAQVQYEAG